MVSIWNRNRQNPNRIKSLGIPITFALLWNLLELNFNINARNSCDWRSFHRIFFSNFREIDFFQKNRWESQRLIYFMVWCIFDVYSLNLRHMIPSFCFLKNQIFLLLLQVRPSECGLICFLPLKFVLFPCESCNSIKCSW